MLLLSLAVLSSVFAPPAAQAFELPTPRRLGEAKVESLLGRTGRAEITIDGVPQTELGLCRVRVNAAGYARIVFENPRWIVGEVPLAFPAAYPFWKRVFRDGRVQWSSHRVLAVERPDQCQDASLGIIPWPAFGETQRMTVGANFVQIQTWHMCLPTPIIPLGELHLYEVSCHF